MSFSVFRNSCGLDTVFFQCDFFSRPTSCDFYSGLVSCDEYCLALWLKKSEKLLFKITFRKLLGFPLTKRPFSCDASLDPIHVRIFSNFPRSIFVGWRILGRLKGLLRWLKTSNWPSWRIGCLYSNSNPWCGRWLLQITIAKRLLFRLNTLKLKLL